MQCSRKWFLWFVFVIVLGVPAIAPAQIVLEIPVGVRSHGLGAGGVADDLEPANVFFNPAILSSLRGIYFNAERPDFPSFGSFGPLDFDHYSLGLGGSYPIRVSPSREARIGIDLRYTKLDFGPSTTSIGGSSATVDQFERYFGISLGAGITIDDRTHIGVGGTVKLFKAELVARSAPPLIFNANLAEERGELFDLGLFASKRVQKGIGTLITSAGISVLNLGGDLEFRLTTGSAAGFFSNAPPKTIRFGVGFRMIGPQNDELTRKLGTPNPAWSLATHLEFEKPQSGQGGTVRGGLESGILNLLFVRVGFFDPLGTFFGSDRPAETTWGLGLKFPYKRFETRIDYARLEARRLDLRENRQVGYRSNGSASHIAVLRRRSNLRSLPQRGGVYADGCQRKTHQGSGKRNRSHCSELQGLYRSNGISTQSYYCK